MKMLLTQINQMFRNYFLMYGMEKDLSIWNIGTGMGSELRTKSSTNHAGMRMIFVAILLLSEEIQNIAMVSQ